MPREFQYVHLWNLPRKNTYIKIDNSYWNLFLNDIVKIAGGIGNLGRKINLKNIVSFRTNFSKYRELESFISLQLIEKMLSVYPENKRMSFLHEIEKNIERIKVGRAGKSIKNPIFPVVFSPVIARISGHLVGDGGIRMGNGGFSVYYTNKCQLLINQFIEEMLKIFNNVDFYLFKDKRDDSITVSFPSIVGVILTKLIGYQINDFKHIPTNVLKGDKITKALFLRALFDDEGCVDMLHHKVQIIMANKNVIEDIATILKEFGIKPCKIIELKNEGRKICYELVITSKTDLETFNREIGFEHPEKKEKLETMLRNYKSIQRRKMEFRNLLISTLRDNGKMNIFDLSNKLNINSINGFRRELWGLEKRGIIKSEFGEDKLKVFYV